MAQRRFAMLDGVLAGKRFSISSTITSVVLFLILSSSALGVSAAPLEKVKLQLKWYHQFQFAGYYAAQTQGYYRDAGLDVEILEGGKGRVPINEVVSGRVQFGVGDSEIVLARIQGEPLVALASIFQHTPHILLSKKSSNINTPADLVGKRIMLAGDNRDAQHKALLLREGVDIRKLTIVPHSRNLDDLLADKVDVISAYATVEPLRMLELGIEPAILSSMDYGIDFYGDTLFTSEAEVSAHPDRVDAFVSASLKGWKYALENPHEIAQLILTMPGVVERHVTMKQLMYEARDMHRHIMPEVVEIGHMNQARWEFIAKVMTDVGVAKPGYDLSGFMRPTAANNAHLVRWFALITLIVGIVMALVLFWNLQIRRKVQESTRDLNAEILQRKLIEKELQSSQELVKLTFGAAAAGIAMITIQGRFILTNPAYCDIVGYSEDELRALDCDALIYEQDSIEAIKNRQRLLHGEISYSVVEKRYRTKSGRPVWVRISASVVLGADGAPIHLIKVVENIEQEKRQELLRVEQRALLEKIAAGGVLNETLHAAVELIEAQSPEVMCSIMLLDKDECFMNAVSTRLPDGYLDALHGLKIGPSVGSCGTAAYERRTVIVEDIAEDRLWREYRAIAQQYDLRACWSMPIFSSTQQVLGTFAVYGKHPRVPESEEMDLVAACSHIVGIAIERARAEDQLRLLETSIARLNDIVLIAEADPRGLHSPHTIFVNKAFEQLTGYSAEDVIGKPLRLLDGPNTQQEELSKVKAALKNGESIRTELINYKKNGEEIWLEMDILPIANAAGQYTHWVAVERDITERKAAESKIQHLAFYDVLTNLPNRLLLLDRLEYVLVNSIRLNTSGALLFIDLDNFKTLNDTHGHDFGDMLLELVAQRIVESVRVSDTVARLGGDEFVVVLDGLSKDLQLAAQETRTVAEKILASFFQPFHLAGYEHYSSSSVGVALFGPQQQVTVDELLKRADLAMYQAKSAGRNTFRFFDPAMQALISERAAMEEDLRQALPRHELILFYQPQVDEKAKLFGAEVLLRWQHPRHGLLSPAGFISLAEETGLILPIGNWVLETACRQLVLWSHQTETARLSLSVNVSARQFRQPDFVEQVLLILEETGADPAYLKLELTESMLVDNIEDVIVKMNALKAMGVGFSMDDFGTGYSSLSYLKRLPLSQLKIDRSFVRDLLIDSNDASIVRTIIALGHGLGLKVIAEGVETQEQQRFLADEGCLAYQGYLFGAPISLVQFEQAFKLG
ncbi:EAL domain-containing protein [Methylobacillus gramineus]|uniref:EAL domain-containing protein n=1 Tax=Methylobacillus gramineus TaxID=755169 RepID=UPI001CFF787C|nr:EAL domain-containing protein [Methylobacillus gramineus]MCB5185829.1 EAL domain-containing protein [Methylobacillus gramineus]